ncbi:hypothetical protein EV188_11114 [Actinomycetospora succinea]|uniref:Uncharacterized protein n=1 Tax=Actinomycetospora succinea TaxID=663603 RepID=A0A4R6UYU6_9PSEU|nr:hypothetical protein [Actinomycetospora succinea]TDQ48844.1 hypothetical protein EV188_11114 [Actinomycetospora succinea]
MAGDVPGDAEVIGAVHAFADAYAFVLQRVYLPPFASPIDLVRGFSMPAVEDVRREMLDALRTVIELRPEGFHQVATGIVDALEFLDEGSPRSGRFSENQAAAIRQLGSWQGAGADAFRTQFDRVRHFAAEQAEAMTDLGGYLLTAYKVAGLARRDTVALLRAGTAACHALVEADDTAQMRADIALSTGVAQSAMTALASTSALGAALGVGIIAIGTTASLATLDLTATFPDTVVDRVRQEHAGLVGRMNAEFDEVVQRSRRTFTKYAEINTLLLHEPLPPSTDVDGPSFRYDDFASPSRTASDFAPDVAEAAREPADQPGVSRIRSALG